MFTVGSELGCCMERIPRPDPTGPSEGAASLAGDGFSSLQVLAQAESVRAKITRPIRFMGSFTLVRY